MALSSALKKLFRLFRALVFAEMVIKKKDRKESFLTLSLDRHFDN